MEYKFNVDITLDDWREEQEYFGDDYLFKINYLETRFKKCNKNFV